MTTIELPEALYDRLLRLAAVDGLTLVQKLEDLVDSETAARKPDRSGFRTDPMGDDDQAPTFNGPPRFSEQVGDRSNDYGGGRP